LQDRMPFKRKKMKIEYFFICKSKEVILMVQPLYRLYIIILFIFQNKYLPLRYLFALQQTFCHSQSTQ
jgi:hypothetical protein